MVKGKLSMNDVIAEALENIQSAENQWHRTYCFRRSKETLTKELPGYLQTVMKEV
jgi:hypothetical protein